MVNLSLTKSTRARKHYRLLDDISTPPNFLCLDDATIMAKVPVPRYYFFIKGNVLMTTACMSKVYCLPIDVYLLY